MDLNSFLRDRRPRWQRLAALLDRIDAKGLGALTPQEADECFSLYRLTSSDLNLVQTRTANPSLIDFLEALVARAYAQLMLPRRSNLLGNYWLIVRHYFPAAIRAEWKPLALSAAALLAGILCGLVATLARPALADVFLPPEQLQESPRERVTTLEDMERNGNTRINSADKHAEFTVFLFNNNIRVSVLAFGLGMTFGIGTAIVVFYNGAMLGSLAALYFLDGVGKFFLAWVGPHGVIELPCVVIASTAGFMLAQSPTPPRSGKHSRADSRNPSAPGGFGDRLGNASRHRRVHRRGLQPDQRTDHLIQIQDHRGRYPVRIARWIPIFPARAATSGGRGGC